MAGYVPTMNTEFCCYLYIGLCSGVNGRIDSAYMDGTGRHSLVDTMEQWPTGPAVDYPARRLYWTDP